MVEPYESRRQKKPTGAVKPINYLGNATTRPYGQSMPTMRPMDPGMRAVAMASAMRHPWQPNISMPPRPASPVQAAPTPQAPRVPWGSAAVANSGNVPGVTVPIVQTMPFQQWTQQQIASGPMNPGLPWAGASGMARPNQTKTLRDKAPETAKKMKERSIAGRAKRNEGLLPEGSRRAMVTAKAQGRRISPVQAGVEASMAAGSPLSDDQKAMMFGPAFAEIQARNEASRMAALASILAPTEGIPQSPIVSNWAMGQLQGMMPGGGAMPTRPLDPATEAQASEGASSAREFQEALIAQGVDKKDANEAARRRFPARQGKLGKAWGDLITSPWSWAIPPLIVPKGAASIASWANEPAGNPAQISPVALASIQQKAAAGDPEAQRILSEGGYSW